MDISIKTPDFYSTNYGVEVAREDRYPESGQVMVRVKHNEHQSTRLQLGLAQAEELHEKLGQLISQIKESDLRNALNKALEG